MMMMKPSMSDDTYQEDEYVMVLFKALTLSRGGLSTDKVQELGGEGDQKIRTVHTNLYKIMHSGQKDHLQTEHTVTQETGIQQIKYKVIMK